MGILAITGAKGLCPHQAAAALGQTAPGAPIVIMIHGFRYCPDVSDANPHDLLFSEHPQSQSWKVISWPKHFAARERALVVGFGWSACGSIWDAYGGAAEAGLVLARAIRTLGAMAPERPVHIIAHSLGARVALHALAALPRGAVQRAVLISPAAFRGEASKLMQQGAGQTVEVFSILGRENTFYDLLLSAAMPLSGATLGRGGPADARAWVDVRLDCAWAVKVLRWFGFRISEPRGRVCHWSGYLRPGVWGFYRGLLLTPEQTPIGVLQAALTAPRRKWSLRLPSGMRTGTSS